LMFGEMAHGTLLSSHRVVPRRLLAAGYTFRHATLEPALRAAVNE
jgi:NAD dependent epimerase/dehydratase family enzyme